MSAVVAFGGFAVCAAVIFFAGRRLSHYGDQIARISGWGGAWVGLVLIAAVTSLPELTVGITSVAVVGSADLAVGDILGSCAFNLLILATMDAFVPERRPIFSVASTSHVLAAALGIILLSLVGLALYLPGSPTILPWIGITSVAFSVVYFSAMRLIYLHGQRERTLDAALEPVARHAPEHRSEPRLLTLRRARNGYLLYAAVIVVAAVAVPQFAAEIAVVAGLNQTFVGTFFLAISTSLPEVAVSLAAVRMGAVDLAVGNLLGSNLFNVVILAVDDVAYTSGLLLKDASDGHLISVLSTIAMSAIVVIGLTYRSRGKRFLMAWDAALILGAYVVTMAVLAGF